MGKRKLIKVMQKYLLKNIKTLIKEGAPLSWVQEIIVTGLVKDVYCVVVGLDEWPDNDNFHDFCSGIANRIIHKEK